MRKADAAGCHRPVHGATHQTIAASLEGLVERRRAAGDNCDADESPDEAGVEGADPAMEASEIKACSGGNHDHDGDANFEEGGIVAEKGVWLHGIEDVIGCRGGGHALSVSRWGSS